MIIDILKKTVFLVSFGKSSMTNAGPACCPTLNSANVSLMTIEYLSCQVMYILYY